MHQFEQLLKKRSLESNLRTLTSSSGLIDFASNDYLGLAKSPELQSETIREWMNYSCPNGSTGSRLLTGNSLLAEELEEEIAHFHHAEAGLLFNSGFCANQGLLAAIAQPEDTILYDAHSHASIYEGTRLSKAKCLAFRHNDANHLEKRLKKAQGRIFVCTEALYSIDGTLAPLTEICSLCCRYGSQLIIDEAHSTGAIGPCGQGLTQFIGCEHLVFARMHTFGKALGVHGSIILGSSLLRKYLINFSRAFIYTTALPPVSLMAIRCAYKMLRTSKIRIEQLKKNCTCLKDGLQAFAPDIQPTETHIQPIPQSLFKKANHNIANIAASLRNVGVDVRAIKHPSVSKRQECLRITLHAYNTHGQINQLIEHLKDYV